MDWKKLRAEYIAGGISYRKLAEKYGVSFSTLSKVASKENWSELRQQARKKTDTKIIEAISNKDAKKVLSVIDAADTLLNKLVEAVELSEVIDSQSIKQFTSALRDLKEIKGEKSKLDKEEQEARIANLRKSAAADNDKNSDIEVIFNAGPEEWNE